MIQKSLVLIKPDALQRGISGDIITRFERAGLKIVAAKLFNADRSQVAEHYKKDDEWAEMVGNHRLDDAKKYNINIIDIYGTEDPIKIGHMVNEANVDYLTMGPVFGFVLEGVNAVAKIRKLVGHTFSVEAAPGTIRGDYGMEAPLTSMVRKRTVFNMIHASGTAEEAEHEISMWFDKDEILTYKRVHEDIYSY